MLLSLSRVTVHLIESHRASFKRTSILDEQGTLLNTILNYANYMMAQKSRTRPREYLAGEESLNGESAEGAICWQRAKLTLGNDATPWLKLECRLYYSCHTWFMWAPRASRLRAKKEEREYCHIDRKRGKEIGHAMRHAYSFHGSFIFMTLHGVSLLAGFPAWSLNRFRSAGIVNRSESLIRFCLFIIVWFFYEVKIDWVNGWMIDWLVHACVRKCLGLFLGSIDLDQLIFSINPHLLLFLYLMSVEIQLPCTCLVEHLILQLIFALHSVYWLMGFLFYPFAFHMFLD